MNPAYRALIWEQSRVADVLTASLAALGAVFALWLRVLAATGLILTRDAQDQSYALGILVLAATVAALAMRFDTRGHLVVGFERRLGRLPVRTGPLVTLLYGTRTFYFTASAILLWLLNAALFGYMPPLGPVVGAVLLFLIVQGFMWSYRSVTGLWYALVLILFIALALVSQEQFWWLAFGLTESEARRWTGDPRFLILLRKFYNALATWPGLSIAAIASYGLAFAGISLERRDARIGLPTAREVMESASAWGARGPRVFDSPLAAQVWYERRRTARIFPAVMIVVCVAAFPILLEGTGRFSGLSLVAQWLPLAAMIIAAPIAGMVSIYGRSRFAAIRPIETRHLAAAKLLVQFRALFLTTLLAAALSALAWRYFGPGEWKMLSDALRLGETDRWAIACLIVAPAIAAAALAWCLLCVGTVHFAILAIVSLAIPLITETAFLAFEEYLGKAESMMVYIAAAQGVTPLLLLFSLLHQSRRRLIASRHVIALACAWSGLTAFLFLFAPRGLHTAPAFVMAFSVSALFFMPLPALLHTVAKRRTR